MTNPSNPDSSHPQPPALGDDDAGSEKYPRGLSGETWKEFAFWLEAFRESILDFCVTRILSRSYPKTSQSRAAPLLC